MQISMDRVENRLQMDECWSCQDKGGKQVELAWPERWRARELGEVHGRVSSMRCMRYDKKKWGRTGMRCISAGFRDGACGQ
ncbi:MAG: hypothetical protein CL912_32195 [Deltaproteobacteria bacterium]|nr:hypothetical protein [Deltaproteobacteria bacterium]